MAHQQFAGLAVIIALAFMALALASCASSEHESFGPVLIAPTEPEAGTPEFHNAAIGGDALRSRI